MSQCTWCGHPPHPAGCPRMIEVAAAPSRGNKTPIKTVGCPCKKNQL